jgi:hypothetical protein
LFRAVQAKAADAIHPENRLKVPKPSAADNCNGNVRVLREPLKYPPCSFRQSHVSGPALEFYKRPVKIQE